MEKENNSEIVILYVNRNDNCFNQILLNEFELDQISAMISNIFSRKANSNNPNGDVMVSNKKLHLCEEVDDNVQTNNREIQRG